MEIIQVPYKWRYPLAERKVTKYIVLHHTASSVATAEDIHKWHLDNGWAGFGYHAHVRKNAKVYSGRPFGTQGAHCQGYNAESIGVCFEGNFEVEHMPKAQVEAGIKLVAYLKKLYPEAKVVGHKDLFPTSCPARYFDNRIFNASDTKLEPEPETELEQSGALKEKIYHLKQMGEPTDAEGLIHRLSEIYANAFETERAHRTIVNQIFRKRT